MAYLYHRDIDIFLIVPKHNNIINPVLVNHKNFRSYVIYFNLPVECNIESLRQQNRMPSDTASLTNIPML